MDGEQAPEGYRKPVRQTAAARWVYACIPVVLAGAFVPVLSIVALVMFVAAGVVVVREHRKQAALPWPPESAKATNTAPSSEQSSRREKRGAVLLTLGAGVAFLVVAAALIGLSIIDKNKYAGKAALCDSYSAYTGRHDGSCTWPQFANQMQPVLLWGGVLAGVFGIGILIATVVLGASKSDWEPARNGPSAPQALEPPPKSRAGDY